MLAPKGINPHCGSVDPSADRRAPTPSPDAIAARQARRRRKRGGAVARPGRAASPFARAFPPGGVGRPGSAPEGRSNAMGGIRGVGRDDLWGALEGRWKPFAGIFAGVGRRFLGRWKGVGRRFWRWKGVGRGHDRRSSFCGAKTSRERCFDGGPSVSTRRRPAERSRSIAAANAFLVTPLADGCFSNTVGA